LYPPCSLSAPPSPSPTLFPYTTLFRSILNDVEHFTYEFRVKCRGGFVEQHDFRVHSQGSGDGDALLLTTRQLVGIAITQATQAQDRKSTRLNSSHVKISYAVFCLKKKM